MATLVREGVLTQLRGPEDYPRRNIADTKNIERFLAHEREKLEDSYTQFVEFLSELLPTPNAK